MRLRPGEPFDRAARPVDMRALPLVLVLVAVLAASCGAPPGVSVSIGTEQLTMVRSSSTRSFIGGSEHGDDFPQRIPVTTIRTSTPVSLRFDTGQGATDIRGMIYDMDSPLPSGGPIEEFALPGRVGTHEARTIAPGRTYQVLVNVKWSGLLTHGEETHVFRVRIDPPLVVPSPSASRVPPDLANSALASYARETGRSEVAICLYVDPSTGLDARAARASLQSSVDTLVRQGYTVLGAKPVVLCPQAAVFIRTS